MSTIETKNVILCVDDEKIVLDSLYRQLQRRFGEEYLYEFAESGEEATEIISELAKDGYRVMLIICDQIMPGMTGDKVLTHLHAADPRAVKILLTGQASLESAINVINHADLYRYVTKPWDEQDLLLTIEKGLERYKLFEQTETQLDLFRKFVPQEFLNFLYQNNVDIQRIQLGDHVASEMTILFTDIRNFTTLSEMLTPEMSFDFINTCIKIVEPAIRENHGFVDKYIGDAIMALFVNADDGLKAAIEIQRAIQKFSEELQAKGEHSIEIGVGLHEGKVMLGIVGVESRMQVTVVSDAVNTASRLETLTSVYGTSVVISGELLELIKNKDQFKFRFLGEIQVKGKSNNLFVHEVIDALPEQVAKKKLETLKEFEKGIHCYLEKQYPEASVQFNLVLKNDPEDKAAQIYFRNSVSQMKMPKAE